ncbi:MAG TPA: rhamnogalacturonan lyase, partial [Lachnospiraceae bacterium]|nr:rhamnogalacturonan lyase [Lachnospiraceae bacterium]
MKVTNLRVEKLEDEYLIIAWESPKKADCYRVYWADKDTLTMKYKMVGETKECRFLLKKATHVPHYFKVAAVCHGVEQEASPVLKTPIKKVFHEQLEKLNRGLVAIKITNGIFLSWRLFLQEVHGYSPTGMTGSDFILYKNGRKLAAVSESTNYVDPDGTMDDEYCVAPVNDGVEAAACEPVKAWQSGGNYLDIPLQIPAGGITPSGEAY